MFTRNLSIIAVILSICLLCFSGCGSGSSGGGSQGGSSGSQSGNKGTILITAPFPAKAAAAKTAATNTAVKPDKKTIRTSRFIPLTVYIYVVTVCEQGTTTAVVSPVNINRPDSGNTVDASVDDVPVGWKTIRVFAYDSNRNLLAQGASDVEVKSADQGSTEASVTLASTSDPPSVSSTTPSNAQTAVSINAKVTVLFSMSMLGSSLSTDTFYLQSSQGKVEGTVSTDGSTAIFTPSSALLPLTTYTAVVSGNVKNTAGLSMGTDYTWSFTTGEKPDTTPPQVKETSPVSGATSIDTGATISAVFTKNIDPATVTSSTFTVTSSKAAVSGTISTLGNSVTFVPATALQAGAAITVTLSGIIKDLAGNAMGTDYTWSFTTKASESGGGGGGGGGGGCTCSWHKEIPKPTFETINDVWVDSSYAVAVGDNGTILVFNGSQWIPVNSGTANHLNAIWQNGSGNYYIAGCSGTVLTMTSTPPFSVSTMTGAPVVDLWGIYGNSGTEFFIVGAGGTIRRYDIITPGWTIHDIASGPDFLDIWCDTSDAVVVGTSGSIYRSAYSAPNWGAFTPESKPATITDTLTSISGSMYNDLNIVGYVNSTSGKATYVYKDGSGYNDYSSSTGTSHDLKGVWLDQLTGAVFAVGSGGIMMKNATPPSGSWTPITSGTSNELRCIMGSASNNIFTAGYNGTVLRFDGTAWSASPGTTLNLNAVWADSSTGRAIAVGNSGAALEYSSGAWKCMNMGTSSENFIGVWGSSISNVLAVSGSTAAPIYKFNGTSWSPSGFVAAGLTAYDIWGRSGSEIYVVGYTGTDTQVYVYNGSIWTKVGGDITGFNGTGIWGPSSGSDIYICGTSSGTDRIYKYFGGAWTAVCNDISISPIDLWGTSSSDIWSVGWAGDAIHGGGSSWGSVTSISSANMRGVWGESSGKFFSVGDSGTIVYYNGSSWSAQSSGVSVDLTGVTGTTSTSVFATGKTGTVLRYY